jgi:GT2 family glycosyltransferase
VGDTAPLVSYIVVNWRTERLLMRALHSIYAQTHPGREVILVDNASPTFDPALVAGYPGLKLIRNEVNRGFAGANNQGIAASRGEFVVLLNADAALEPAFTSNALRVFDSDPLIGTVVPLIWRDDGSGRIDSAGHRMYDDRTTAHIGRDELHQGQYGYPREVFGGTAAANAYRRAMIDDIALSCGLFDDSFFAYFEDVDVDWRANLSGWRAVYTENCAAWHRGHGSGGRASRLIQLRAEKNRYLMLARNDSCSALLRNALPVAIYELYHLAGTLLRPWVWPSALQYLWRLPAAFDRRREASPAADDVERTRGLFRPRGLQPPEPEIRLAPESRQADWGQQGLISVVVLNYNGLAQTLQCLATLQDQSAAGFEVIVVDNGSRRDEAAEIRRRYPGHKVLRLEQNHGFAGGVNWGLTLARGEYIVLVNNDSLLDRE